MDDSSALPFLASHGCPQSSTHVPLSICKVSHVESLSFHRHSSLSDDNWKGSSLSPWVPLKLLPLAELSTGPLTGGSARSPPSFLAGSAAPVASPQMPLDSWR